MQRRARTTCAQLRASRRLLASRTAMVPLHPGLMVRAATAISVTQLPVDVSRISTVKAVHLTACAPDTADGQLHAVRRSLQCMPAPGAIPAWEQHL